MLYFLINPASFVKLFLNALFAEAAVEASLMMVFLIEPKSTAGISPLANAVSNSPIFLTGNPFVVLKGLPAAAASSIAVLNTGNSSPAVFSALSNDFAATSNSPSYNSSSVSFSSIIDKDFLFSVRVFVIS